ncbi:lipase member H-like [Lucilia sericata]|uniref:lipase member H-like n=1 Tax=Lucilia sericata TaxID=13632 RepID=UPI0018A809FA|nr:lipase member H-like [Lucilia sericata]
MKNHKNMLFSLCLSVLIVITNCYAHNRNYFKNELGYCEPLTVEFIAGLVTKEARQLLDPSLRPRHKDLRFDLYTRKNPYEKQMLYTGQQDSILKSNFNAKWPTRISFHGWNGQTKTCSSAAIKDAYLAKGDFNIILVDWSDYSLNINYVRVVNEIFQIAKQFNDFTRFLYETTNVPFKDMYLIGHSYGSHIAGIAGKLLKPEKYGVIYALDTAGPIHSVLNDNWRLTASDALYVESIQTDTGLFGFRSANLGHASFFPNWGLGQPHCPNVTVMEPDFTCDHFGALYYFVESISRERAFGAIQCKSYESIINQKCNCGADNKNCPAQVYMGGEPAQPKRGIYYLSTRKVRPFGYGDVCRIKKAIQPTIVRITN